MLFFPSSVLAFDPTACMLPQGLCFGFSLGGLSVSPPLISTSIHKQNSFLPIYIYLHSIFQFHFLLTQQIFRRRRGRKFKHKITSADITILNHLSYKLLSLESFSILRVRFITFTFLQPFFLFLYWNIFTTLKNHQTA